MGSIPTECNFLLILDYVSDVKKSTPQRFELWRAKPNRFLIYLLNHSDTVSELISSLVHCIIVYLVHPFNSIAGVAGLVVMMGRCQRLDPGSIPGRRILLNFWSLSKTLLNLKQRPLVRRKERLGDYKNVPTPGIEPGSAG